MKHHHRTSGFTLIELAVVMFITTMFLGAIIAMVNSALVNQQVSGTKSHEDAVKQALVSFINRNYRLPCPAIATLAEGAAAEGVEAPTPGTCTGVTISGAGASRIASGVVPWSSLGLSRDVVFDAYGNRLTYIVTLGTTGLTSTTLSGMTGYITTHSAGLGVLGASPAGNQLNDCSSGAPTNPCALVAAVISHGSDSYGAYQRSGNQVAFDAAVTGNDARENANADGKIVLKDFSSVSDNPYDDIVLGVTSSELLMPLLQSGSLKDYRASLNATFQLMQSTAIAYAANNRSGSAGSYSYNLPPNAATFYGKLTAQQVLDPWGTTIDYATGTGAVSSGTNSNSTAFTLKSAGPNKVLNDSDDISLAVSVGDVKNILQLSGW